MDHLKKKLLREIKEIRTNLKNQKFRYRFWRSNRRRAGKNVMRLTRWVKLKDPWKFFVILFDWQAGKRLHPYDMTAWSITDLVAATKKQGHEVAIFLNRCRVEFLSAPAMFTLIIHELGHVKQAITKPAEYLKAVIDDGLAQKHEIEAEEDVKRLPKAFREQAALEAVLYCYDIWGWKVAAKMAKYMHMESMTAYCGGYEQEMTDEEYAAFVLARKEKNIKIFIDHFYRK